MSEKLSIKITIANRVYPLTINRSEEEQIRKAAAQVNENVRELEDSYAVRDKQDLLAMTALYFADKSMAVNAQAGEVNEQTASQIQKVHDRLASFLGHQD